MTPIVIDQAFKNLIPPLDDDEYRQLRENIDREGCRDPIVVWQDRNILLDGHHRHAICSELDKPFQVVAIPFADRFAAEEWILQNQLGRRNLSPDMTAYIRGRLYETRKRREGRPEKRTQIGDVSIGRTVDQLASETGTSKNTIQRDAAFAKAVDVIEATAGPEAKNLILSGKSGMTREHIKRLALQAPDKVEFEMEIRRERAGARREDRDIDELIDPEAAEEATRIRQELKQDRQLKKLDIIHQLAGAWDSFMRFILKARGDESPQIVLTDWTIEEATWMHEQSCNAISELQTWKIAIEKQFPKLRHKGFHAVVN